MGAMRSPDLIARIAVIIVGIVATLGVCGVMAVSFVGCGLNGTEDRLSDWRTLVDEPGGGIYIPPEAVAVKAESHENMVSYGGRVIFKLPATQSPEEWLRVMAHRTPGMPAGKVDPLHYDGEKEGPGMRAIRYEPTERLYYAEWYVD